MSDTPKNREKNPEQTLEQNSEFAAQAESVRGEPVFATQSPKVVFKDLDTMGARLRGLRGFLGVSRKEMEQLFDIKEPTLKAWEVNQVKAVNPKSIAKIIETLRQAGLHVTEEWLIHGEGLSPFDTGPTHTPFYDSAQDLLYREQYQFQNFDRDRVTFVVPDGLMLPYFKRGDVVGGKRLMTEDLQRCLGMLCIFFKGSGEKMVGKLTNGLIPRKFSILKDLSCTDPSSFTPLPLNSNVYEIIWWRKGV